MALLGVFVALLLSGPALTHAGGARAATLGPEDFGILFLVDSGSDESDLFPGDGLCQTALGTCTLRAAVEEINARNSGLDGIEIEVPLVTLTQALPDLTTTMEIRGSGPDQMTVQRNADYGTPEFRILNVTMDSPAVVSIFGLTIQYGFFSDAFDPTKDGGGVRNSGTGTITLTNCKLIANGSHGNDFFGGTHRHRKYSGLLLWHP